MERATVLLEDEHEAECDRCCGPLRRGGKLFRIPDGDDRHICDVCWEDVREDWEEGDDVKSIDGVLYTANINYEIY